MKPVAQKSRKTVAREKRPTEKPAAAASPAQPGRAERRCQRLPVRQICQPCQLKVEQEILPAALINDSRTGFSVLTDRREGLKIGEKVELSSKAGRATGEIVYIKKITPCASPATKCDSLFQVGVKKTRCAILS
jgi:hypothetical protein